MKKILTLSLLLASAALVAPATQAKNIDSEKSAIVTTISTLEASAQGRYYRNQRVRIVTRTVRRGYRTYRETYRIVSRPNGRVVTTLISRVRIR